MTRYVATIYSYNPVTKDVGDVVEQKPMLLQATAMSRIEKRIAKNPQEKLIGLVRRVNSKDGVITVKTTGLRFRSDWFLPSNAGAIKFYPPRGSRLYELLR